ncbi:aldehyde dehydrogenase family protein [Vagococcus sp. DIV0080]|uniref:Aldehyde dehydrogenase family protein n=1 Tax=Candidatus Vagococcus giribetii TaxID=2230876 RepID=A0ABS3HTT6_9ENTE|nr:aldehyde dehydrogenase family protein [Vagococcus sp. DIV0080]MBO0477166.1 aldehyde dehydrogenase family protein [Vagococcus sp. DIV0080]
MSFVDKDLESIQEARILMESARDSHYMLKEYDQGIIDKIIGLMIPKIRENAQVLIDANISETQYGKAEDELKLLYQVLDNMESSVLSQKCIGVLEQNTQGDITEVGVPLGVIVTLLPAENSVTNTIFTALLSLKSGNTCVFVPHKRGANSTRKAISFIKNLAEVSGLPKNCLSSMQHVSNEGVAEITNHSATALIINIGQKKCKGASNVLHRPMIYGGTGSTPVFIEKTANIKQACFDIIRSRSFNNGILPGAEQYLIVEGIIANQVKEELINQGAHFMTQEEERLLLDLIKPCGTFVCSEVIGKSACYLAEKAGFAVRSDVKVLVSEQDYIFDENPYSDEMKFPILTFYLEPDWLHACEKCINLLKAKQNGHSLVIHSHNQKVTNEFALKKPVGRVLVNGPATFNSLGLESTLPFTFVLGGLTMGQGITAKNITAKDLTYVRQIGYPIEKTKSVQTDFNMSEDELVRILKKIINQ